MKQPFPESVKLSSSNPDIQRLQPHSTHHHHHHAHFKLDPTDIYQENPHHRKSHSISSIHSLTRPASTNLVDSPHYLPRRRPTLSHDSSSKHLLTLGASGKEKSIIPHTTSNPNQPRPRSNSVSIKSITSIANLSQPNQLKTQRSSSSLRSKTPVQNDPLPTNHSLRTNLIANRSCSSLLANSSYYHPRQPPQPLPRFNVHGNDHHHPHHQPTPPIGSIKHSLVESIHKLPCSLHEKLFFVAKLHAEVEAELRKLELAPASNRSYTPSLTENQNLKNMSTRQEIDDPIHLIKLSDRIKALAVQQLKQDLYR